MEVRTCMEWCTVGKSNDKCWSKTQGGKFGGKLWYGWVAGDRMCVRRRDRIKVQELVGILNE